MDWPEGKDCGISPEEEVTRAEEAPLYNKLPENEKQYALFTDGSCRIVGKHRRWKAAVWSPIRQVVETAEGDGESSQFAEVKAIQLVLDIAEQEKWPVLYLYNDSWMVANALYMYLQGITYLHDEDRKRAQLGNYQQWRPLRSLEKTVVAPGKRGIFVER
ncbi:hypothetical protein QYF61_013285 [Mycteria americana]|uniref:RNase H type-1 domain-containing protein n=1 Tax=Mycteria americana TaxID=33587 RepID=A0AAN7N931_MYCAM|nr:hypothetical protein QYF61_013285 [Mycteria americana]